MRAPLLTLLNIKYTLSGTIREFLDNCNLREEKITFNFLTAAVVYNTFSVKVAHSRRVSLRAAVFNRVKVFTKPGKPNKLYVDDNSGLFLSSGIILRFNNAVGQKFLKKRVKIWHAYVKAIRLLRRPGLVLFFNDLFGKKNLFLLKLLRSNLDIA